jgi:hypothetical protein
MSAPLCQKSFVLTVSESKRLIARGVARCQAVREALEKGVVAVAKGTTNAYVVEELTGQRIQKPHYCTGTTRPEKAAGGVEVANKLPDLVLRKGQKWEGVTAVEALAQMGPGDVFMKGANALNYDRGQAGILIGHPTGGTLGAALGTVVARRITFIVPVGLEKSVPGDLFETARALVASAASGAGPMLWPVAGAEIFTEIEALDVLCGVAARPIGAGGILGAEGSVRMSVWGSPEDIQRAESVIGEIRGEPPFGA